MQTILTLAFASVEWDLPISSRDRSSLTKVTCTSYVRRSFLRYFHSYIHFRSNLYLNLSPGKELNLKVSSREEKELWKCKLEAVISEPMPKLDLDPTTMYDGHIGSASTGGFEKEEGLIFCQESSDSSNTKRCPDRCASLSSIMLPYFAKGKYDCCGRKDFFL